MKRQTGGWIWQNNARGDAAQSLRKTNTTKKQQKCSHRGETKTLRLMVLLTSFRRCWSRFEEKKHTLVEFDTQKYKRSKLRGTKQATLRWNSVCVVVTNRERWTAHTRTESKLNRRWNDKGILFNLRTVEVRMQEEGQTSKKTRQDKAKSNRATSDKMNDKQRDRNIDKKERYQWKGVRIRMTKTAQAST